MNFFSIFSISKKNRQTPTLEMEMNSIFTQGCFETSLLKITNENSHIKNCRYQIHYSMEIK